jgi:ribosomal protein L37AE/L43A
MTSCPACEKAARVRSHDFMADCDGCKARAAGRMPQFAEARKAGVQTHAYRRLLQQFGLTHEQVRAAVAADKAAKV